MNCASRIVKLSPLALGLLLGSGCVSSRVREAAAVTLDCPKGVQVKENRENKGWVADGCGRQAYCVVPPVKGADVQCAGGGPPRATEP